ncbi:MAG: TatD-related deoxyribonuclease [Promethearchaeota archaeon CR_4]|nr:MAG: TatD-related deoxyribonuclease [Candidatus Lokiarchaeota archaeon CR_4]
MWIAMSKTKTPKNFKPNLPEPLPNLPFIDVHCHLPLDFSPKDALPTPDTQYVEFIQLGGLYLISSTIDWKSLTEIREFASHHEFMGFTCGWAPQTVTYTSPEAYKKEWTQWFEYVTTHPEDFLAIGEIGLDFHHAKKLAAREKQVQEFRKVLQIALDLRKPVVLHVRNAGTNEIDLQNKAHPYNLPDGANQVILEILAEFHIKSSNVMWHCFSGPAPYGVQLSRQGYWLSVPSSAWGFPRWVRNTKEVPIDHLLTETDASFQHPWRPGPENVPVNVRYSIAAIAYTHQIPQEDVAHRTVQNAINFFRLETKVRKI